MFLLQSISLWLFITHTFHFVTGDACTKCHVYAMCVEGVRCECYPGFHGDGVERCEKKRMDSPSSCNCNHNITIPSDTPTCPELTTYGIVTNTSIARHARKLFVEQGSKTDICPAFTPFSKYVKVFDLYFIATKKSPDYKLLHAASVFYQYLDNDDDGKPDNKLVYKKLVEFKATMFMFYDSDELEANMDFFENAYMNCPGVKLQDVQSDETRPGSISEGDFDASLEETFHLITSGYFAVYPELNERPGSHLTCIMDCARGGKFDEDIPLVYPTNAWFTYDDKTCKYGCMAYEYIYWGLTTYLRAQQMRKDEINREWRPSTCEELKRIDKPMYDLIRDPKYKFPKRLPVGIHFVTSSSAGTLIQIPNVFLLITMVIVKIC